MSTQDERTKSIFLNAAEIVSESERSAYLDEQCGNDAELRRDVEDLLRHQKLIGSFLESSPLGASIDQPITEKPGAQIGPYKLLQQIGEGGMGVVYRAEQKKPVKRQVALKIIKPGMDTRQVIARFEAERQALAMMDHPNIAKVLDAGATESGRPYFVMELVNGLPVTKYCDEQHLTPRERLELFVPICQAAQHAHQKGIIHRDLKPSNILVALYDGKAVPKIIDFGVAKATTQTLTERTTFTQLGQVVGTLEYMSPEQAERNQLDIDTRSDIYSLGVVLYELLTGETPFDRERLRSAAFDEMLRIIREEEPPRPSTKLSSSHTLPSVAANRNIEPVKLSSLIRGELDWIVMKALEKDRGQRYETASGLAADVQRYLNDEAVVACPASVAYRIRKFTRRNKVAIVTALLVAISLVGGTCAATWQAIRANRARLDAENAQTQIAAERDNVIAAKNQLQTTLYYHLVTLAYRELAANSVGRVYHLLEQCPESLRDWEWYHIDHMADRSIRSWTQHSHRVIGIAVRPDAKRFASASWDGTVRIWDLQTGEQLEVLPAQTDENGAVDEVWKVDYSPDGKQIAVGTWGAIRVWNVEIRAIELEIDVGQQRPVSAVAFSPDGRRIASVFGGPWYSRRGGERVETADSNPWSVNVWDASTGQRILELPGHTDIVWCVAFSPDGKQIISGSKDRTLRLWHAETGELLKVFEGHDAGFASVAFDPDGLRLAAGSWDGSIRLGDVESRELEQTIPGHEHAVCGIAFHPRGHQLVSASIDNSCKIWNATNGAELMLLRGHEAPVWDVAYTPDGTRIISASYDETVKLWDATRLEQNTVLRGHAGTIRSVAFSPDDRWIASGSRDNTVRLWSAADGRETWVGHDHDDDVTSVIFTPNGKRLISASEDKTVRIWEVDSGRCVRTLDHPDGVMKIACTPDGRSLVSGCADHEVRVWNLADGRLQSTLSGHTGTVISVACSWDGRWAASGSADGTCRVWDLHTGSMLHTFRGHVGPVYSLAFSPDSRLIVSCCMYTRQLKVGDIRFWDPLTGRETVKLQSKLLAPCASVAFSPDGRRVVAPSLNGSLLLFDPRTGEEVLVFRAHQSEASCAKFDSSGRRIVSSGSDALLKIWKSSQSK